MLKQNNKGQIAIFLSIVFIAVLFFSGILVDGVRIISGKTSVKRALEDACVSTLALYNSQLKNDYGVFALSENNSSVLKETFESYLVENLNIKSNSNYSIDLYDFKIENLIVTPIYNLTNSSTVKKQILDYMKYRAPKELGENILKKLSLVKDIGEMALLYEKKTQVEKELGDVENLQKKLKKNISGTIGDGIYEIKYIEKFNIDGVLDDLVIKYTQLISVYAGLLSDVNESQENQENFDLITHVKKDISRIYNQLSDTYTKDFIKVNESAIATVKKLMEKGQSLNAKINELSEIAESSFDEDSNILDEQKEYIFQREPIANDFKNALNEDLNNIKHLVPDYEKGKNMIRIMEDNISAMNSFLTTLNDINNKIDIEKIDEVDISSTRRILHEINQQYKTIEFEYLLPEKGHKQDDPRKGVSKKAKEALADLIAKGLNANPKNIDFDQLPSRKKVVESDDPYDPIEHSAPINSGYNGDFSAIGDDINLTKTNSTFPKKGLDFIVNIGKKVGDIIINNRDDLYISQYIISNFNCRTDKGDDEENDEIDDEAYDAGYYSANDETTGGFETTFQEEIEYILHGSEWEKINLSKTIGQVTLIRFGINTLEMYIDPVKKKEAYSIATAVAGWWTGGAGIPIIANLILCSQGMIEGLNDVRKLVQGHEIPLFKKSNINFSYKDYLVLLLIQQDEELKVNRILDLMELNIRQNRENFRMGSAYSAIKVEAEVSMKYLFVTQSFMPVKVKTSDGRHRIDVVMYQGY